MPTGRLSTGSTESDEGIDQSFLEYPLPAETTKTFHDMIHGHITLPSICYSFMNTPQFQRLKNLKQLGLCYYVFPTASNNRFEHCVGTSYLAGEYTKILRSHQPELNITDEDVKCLYLAGLCHDIGHGPFSHLWERFMHEMNVDNFHHELMSLNILDNLIEENEKIIPLLRNENLGEQDIIFIKELILGHPLPGNENFQGRPPCKHFLYQIVANGITKIDVDKFDYLLRDSKQLGVTTDFDYKRMMNNSRVVGYYTTDTGTFCKAIEEDTPTMILYRKKIESSLESLFHSRYNMHKQVYQHRVTLVIEEMILDALKAAEPDFIIKGKNGTEYKFTTAWEDPSAFIKLTDSVIDMIRQWSLEGSKAAKILDRVVERKLYKFLGCFDTHIDQNVQDELTALEPNIRFLHRRLNYGGGAAGENPLNKVFLYEKSRPNHLIQKKIEPEPQENRTFVVYCTNNFGDGFDWEEPPGSIKFDVQFQAAKDHVQTWSKRHQIDLSFE